MTDNKLAFRRMGGRGCVCRGVGGQGVGGVQPGATAAVFEALMANVQLSCVKV